MLPKGKMAPGSQSHIQMSCKVIVPFSEFNCKGINDLKICAAYLIGDASPRLTNPPALL